MRATILNCSLKSSPEPSNTEALARGDPDPRHADVAGPDDAGRPVAYNRVAGFVVTGNEDGAHHCIAELAQGVIDIGWTVPGQAWTYWNKGPGPGPSYSETDEGKDWSHATGRTAAANLVAVARALEAEPVPPPPS